VGLQLSYFSVANKIATEIFFSIANKIATGIFLELQVRL
jgi:hypothetical protein